ncbi:hypothetical protein B0A55_11749 [Friedmanniomyces simplex]|uniref:Galactose oxidase n=1 Tax=Friedmanniomyces simplex TaxID=329884 RepID=A0A4U0WPQ6_9PEZI|nr:hypothetical protein B0A55_11749 [Friedmanniomyces simplex]
MAEIAAAAWAVEEVVSTTAQVGVGAYMVSKPTMPMKATFSQIATSSDDNTRLSLSRSGHSICVVGNKAYIFGGETATGKLASNDTHSITLAPEEKPDSDYAVIPAIPDQKDGPVPVARTKHAACGFNICVAVFGGLDEAGDVLDETCIWLFVTGKSSWESIRPKDGSAPSPEPRSESKLFDHQNKLLLYGGKNKAGEALKDVWLFDYGNNTWRQFPDAPVSSSNAALCNGVLHIISGTDDMSSDLHLLELGVEQGTEHKWQTIPFPTNPMTPGPRPRFGAGLLPITTGYGRNYLAFFFGARQHAGGDSSTSSETQKPSTQDSPTTTNEPTYWSDIWTYQLPSTSHEAKPTFSLSEAIKPAKIKDSIRHALGYDSGGHSWGEAEVMPPADLEASAGKVHPGPRGFFGCDVMKDGRSFVMWGGIDAKGEREGDGWIIRLE